MIAPDDIPFEWGCSNAAGPSLLHRVEVVGGALFGALGVLVGAGAVLSLDLRDPALIFAALLVGAACGVLAARKVVPLVQRALVRVGLVRLPGVPLWHDWIVRAEDEHGRSVGGWLSATTYRDALPKYSPMRIWSEARQQWREQLPKRASRVAVYKVAVIEPWNRPALHPRRMPPPGTLVGWIDDHGQHERRELSSGRRKRKARPGRCAPNRSGGP